MPLRQRNLCSDCVCVCVITLSFLRISNVEIVYLTCLSDYWLEVEVGTQLKNSFLTFLSWLTGVREAFQSEPSGLAYFVSFILEVPPLLLLYWWDLEELAVKYEECVTPMMPLVLVNISRVNGGQPHTLHCYSAKQRVTSCSCSCKRKSDGVCSEWTQQSQQRLITDTFPPPLLPLSPAPTVVIMKQPGSHPDQTLRVPLRARRTQPLCVCHTFFTCCAPHRCSWASDRLCIPYIFSQFVASWMGCSCIRPRKSLDSTLGIEKGFKNHLVRNLLRWQE